MITILGIDTSVAHNVKLTFGSEVEPTAVFQGLVPVLGDESNLPNDYSGINLSVDWNNVNITSEGLYALSIYVDGDMIDSKEIYIKGKNQ